MPIMQTVRCPNCGSLAERHHLTLVSQVKTECQACDYLMITCVRTGRVIEAYAPGLQASRLIANQSKENDLMQRFSEVSRDLVALDATKN